MHKSCTRDCALSRYMQETSWVHQLLDKCVQSAQPMQNGSAHQPQTTRRTGHHDLLSRLGITQEVRADALLGGVLSTSLRVVVQSAAYAQRGGLAIKVIAIAGGSDGVQAHTVWHLLAPAVHLGTLLMRIKGTADQEDGQNTERSKVHKGLPGG